MTNLMLMQFHRPVSQDEAEVRSTVTVVDHDQPSSVQGSAPDFNELDVDAHTEGGLTRHDMASYVIGSERYAPAAGNANEDLNARVNNQVSSSGTAAAREAAGQWGHGTMKIVEGIEPTIRDGMALSSDYFASSERPDAGSANYMTPAQASDPVTTAQAQTTGNNASRDAAAASMYGQMLANLEAGVS